MTYCTVPGCASDSDLCDSSTNFTFHPIPSSLIQRTQWILALGPLPDHSYVCSRHFDETMFTNHENRKILIPNAVPKLFLHSLPNDERASCLRECPDEAGSSDELVACRACLAADGRLYAISGSGLEDALATLTGIAMPAEASFPRHLCAFCVTKLSKCVAFRDSCRRSTALLESLLEKGPLRMNVIKAFNRKSQKLTNNLTCSKVFHIGTDSFIEIMPLIKTENKDSSHEEAKCAKVECIESENCIKKDASDADMRAFELAIEKRERPRSEVKSRTKNIECCLLKDELEIEKPNAHSEIDDCVESEVENNTSDVDTDTSEETLATVKKRRRTSVTLKKENTAKSPRKRGYVKIEVNKHPTNINTDTPEETTGSRKKAGIKSSATESAFEKKNNRKTKLLNNEEEKPKSWKRKKMNKTVYNCDLCGREYKNLNNFKRHKSSHDPNLSKEILATLKKDKDLDFEKKYNFEIKILSKEEQKQRIEDRRKNASQYSCDVCGKYHLTESALKMHKTSYHDPSLPVECDVCWYRFRSRQELRQHQLEDRHRAIFTCKECGNVTRNRVNAKDHCLMHRGNTHTCPYCHKRYDRMSSYYGHIRLSHPGENEACDECGETFMGKVGLLVHKKMRHKTNDNPKEDLKCKDCDVEFSCASALQRHCELGAGVPHAALWACAACGDSCGSETARANHAAERHPPEHYCKECDKTFSDASSFALHVDRKHKGRRAANAARVRHRRLVCEMCGKVFICLATLQYHMNGHLGLKPYQCPHCPKAFAHKTKLKQHTRIHTGERPYQCKQCPLAFTLRGNFTRHIKNVHLRVQVACDTCGKTMGAGSLPAHIRAVHMNRPFVRRKRDRTNKTQARVAES